LEVFLPRRRGKTNSIAFRNTIRDNVNHDDGFHEYDSRGDIGFHLGNMEVTDGICFENTFFVPARDSPVKNTFFDIKLDRKYDSRSNIGFPFGKYNITDDTSDYVPFVFIQDRNAPGESIYF
jgi:hypothetical protein